MNAELWWYVARAGGIVAWSLLAASVLWGLALSTRVLGPRPHPSWMLDLHRFLGGLALTFTGLHVAGLVLDSYVSFGPVELLVPFTGGYRPVAVAWGVVGLYLLAAVQITSMLRHHLSRRTWRRTHLLSFPLFATASIHGITAGTDATGAPLRIAMAATSALVLGLTVASLDQHLRAARSRHLPRPVRRPIPHPTNRPVPHTTLRPVPRRDQETSDEHQFIPATDAVPTA